MPPSNQLAKAKMHQNNNQFDWYSKTLPSTNPWSMHCVGFKLSFNIHTDYDILTNKMLISHTNYGQNTEYLYMINLTMTNAV